MKIKLNRVVIAIYLSAVVLFSVTNIQAQPGWAKNYGTKITSGASKPVYSMQTYDGGYLTLSSIDSASVFGMPYLFKAASDGSLLWSLTLGLMYRISVSAIIPLQLPDSGFLMMFPTPSQGNNNCLFPTDSLTLVKVDKNGNVEWQRYLNKYSFSNCATSTDSINTKFMNTRWAACHRGNGNILLAGNFKRMLNATTLGFTHLVIETDTAGNVIGSSTLDTLASIPLGPYSGANNPLRLVASPTGFLLAEKFLLNSVSYDTYIKLDAYLNIVYKKTLPSNFNIDTFKPTPADSGFILASNTLPRLIKLDHQGSVLWTSPNLNILTGNGIKCIQQTSDGGFITAGVTTNRMFISKTDAIGNAQWQKVHGMNILNHEAAYSVIATTDNGYLLSGTIQDIFSQARQVRLVKTDSLGNVITNYISGYVFNDLDADCLMDIGEPGIGGRIVEITPGAFYTSTDPSGYYYFETGPGTFTVKLLPHPNNLSVSCPLNGHVVNVASYDSVYNVNFADSIVIHCADLTINAGIDVIRPCMNSTVGIAYSNNGTDSAFNVVINYHVTDPEIIPLSSSIPWTQIAPGVYQFQIGTFPPGASGTITITDSISCNAVAGTSKCLFAEILPSLSDCDTMNNTKSFCRWVTGSYDPNDKQVESVIASNGYVNGESISNSHPLNYMIRFQNTGSDTAFTVVVIDTLSANIDLSSVQSGASSNSYSFRITGERVLEWTFNNINLPDSSTDEYGSHGFVMFSAKPTGSLVNGSVINNMGAIVFDYNSAVLTNTCSDTVQFASTSIAPVPRGAFSIYPNPASGTFNVFGNPNAATMHMEIRNPLGEIVYHDDFTESGYFSRAITFNGAKGIYLISITTEKGIWTEKLIKK